MASSGKASAVTAVKLLNRFLSKGVFAGWRDPGRLFASCELIQWGVAMSMHSASLIAILLGCDLTLGMTRCCHLELDRLLDTGKWVGGGVCVYVCVCTLLMPRKNSACAFGASLTWPNFFLFLPGT